MLLHHLTWKEVEAHLIHSTGIVIPIGSTEQHGPNGLIGTDAICPEVIAGGVGNSVGALVAPTINLGVAQHHLGFPGTISLRPSTLIALVNDIIESLMRHGLNRFYFLNGHGGNIATISSAFAEVYSSVSLDPSATQLAPVRLKLANWWQGKRVRELSTSLFGDAEGSHATPSEVSLTYYVLPACVKSVEMAPKIAPGGTIRDADDYRRQFPDGRIGSDPSLATAAAGKRLYEAAVQDVSEDYREFLSS